MSSGPPTPGVEMTEYVELTLKRGRGWPWSEDRRRGFTAVEGGCVPGWQFDAICLESSPNRRVIGPNGDLGEIIR